MKMLFEIFVFVISTSCISLSYQCPLHDVVKSSTRTSINHIQLDNETLAQIYQNTTLLLKEVGNGDSLLVQLNQTSTNASILALIVKNSPQIIDGTARNEDILQQYRMYYVTLVDEPTNSYRLYWKIFVDYFRSHMNTIWGALWSPISLISKLWRQSAQQQTDHILTTTTNTFTFPVMLRAIELSDDIEKRIIEFDYGQEKEMENIEESVKDKMTQQVAEKFLMRVISAFQGKLKPNRQNLIRNGIIITDKDVRINFIGEQKITGDIDIFMNDQGSKQPTKP